MRTFKRAVMFVFALFIFDVSAFAGTKEKKIMTIEDNGMKVLSIEGAAFNPGPEAYFTGTVTVAPMFKEIDPSALSCGCVNFQAGARSAWHTHPKGQLLIIKEGEGYVQEWGKPIQKIKKGDLIWTPPGVKHWHGARPESGMVQFAVQESKDSKNVEWLEKVTDAEYNSK